MISKKMENMVANSSAIRAMFEEGNRLAGIYGAENVYDFSLGNPNVPAPEAVKKAIIDLLKIRSCSTDIRTATRGTRMCARLSQIL